jgi:hypothetical protein
VKSGGSAQCNLPRIRLNPKIDRPWLRKPEDFKHPQLIEWAIENRARLIHAIIVLVKAWIQAGRPLHTERLGSFEEWSAIIGGILNVAGIEGFLDNQNLLYEKSDIEGQEWREFIDSWLEEFQSKPKRPCELHSMCKAHDLMINIIGSGSDRSQVTNLGNALLRSRGRIFSGFRIDLAQDLGKKGKFYCLVPTGPIFAPSTDYGDQGDLEAPFNGAVSQKILFDEH